MTTGTLFVVFNILQGAAILLAIITVIQLIRARHSGMRNAWIRRALPAPAIYLASFLPLVAGLLLMAPNAQLTTESVLAELRSWFREPDLFWPPVFLLLGYALIIAVASFVAERRFEPRRV